MRPPAGADVSHDANFSSCPLETTQKMSPEEAVSQRVPDIRAYKLGKKRWSYNQCELVLLQEGSTNASKLTVVEAVHDPDPALHSDIAGSQASYQLKLSNDHTIHIVVYLVHSHPTESIHGEHDTGPKTFHWESISRRACQKGCEGPVLRTLRRFGAFGRRSNGPQGSSAQFKAAERTSKDARYMYLSIDEAGTHVGAKTFRLVAGVYDKVGQELLGTACSPPIRVLSNNDAPSGAAHITLAVTVSKDWAGWANSCKGLECEPSGEPTQLPPQPLRAPVQVNRRDSLHASSPAVSPPSADAETQGHIKPAQAWARDPRLLTAGSHDDVAFCDQTLPACWSDLGTCWQETADAAPTAQIATSLRQQSDGVGLVSSLEIARTPVPSCQLASFDKKGTQHAQHVTSAHETGLVVAPGQGLSVETAQGSHCWQTASPFIQRSRAHPSHAHMQSCHSQSPRHEYDTFPRQRPGVLLSSIHPFFDSAMSSPSSFAMLPSESQDQAQGVDAHGSHTSLNIQAGPPSYGSPGSTQQQPQPQCSDELGSSSLARKRVAAFDPGLADDVSQEQINASDPQSSREGSQRFNLQGSHRDDREQQHAGTAGRGVQGQGAVGARAAAEPEHIGPALQELLAKLARGQGARVKKLKRKVSWHADELQQEKAKVASIQQELSSTNQELRFLRQQVAHLQHAAQHPIVGLAPSMQPRLFGPYPLLAQENQPAAYFAARVQETMTLPGSISAPPSSSFSTYQPLYNSLFRGSPHEAEARSTPHSLGECPSDRAGNSRQMR